MSEETNKEEKPQYTPEQLKEMRDKTDKFYDEQIPYLEKQYKYFDLLAKIEEAKTREMTAMYQSARLFAASQDAEEGEGKPETEKKQ